MVNHKATDKKITHTQPQKNRFRIIFNENCTSEYTVDLWTFRGSGLLDFVYKIQDVYRDVLFFKQHDGETERKGAFRQPLDNYRQ